MSFFALDPLPRSIGAALSDVTDKKETVRASAVRDLSRHAGEGDARAAVALIDALSTDASSEVRSAAALALADAHRTEARGALLEASSDRDVRVREMALLALGELGEEGDVEILRAVERALGDSFAAVRFQAVIAANRLGAPGARAVLFDATRDKDAKVRHVAFRLLEERATSADERVEVDDETRETAVTGLEDDVLSVRLAAAILLAHANDRAGADVLVEAVNRKSGEVELDDEQAAISLVGSLGLPDAVGGLRRRAWGVVGRDPLAFEARVALARLGDERAKEKILRGLGAWTRDARTMAVVAAGRARLSIARDRIAGMRGDPNRAEPEAVDEALELLNSAR